MSRCHQAGEAVRRQAEAAAAAIRAQARAMLPPEEEPMKRYPHPICPCTPPSTAPGLEGGLDCVLEALARQNQLLTELLGAVNGLTAAVLARQGPL